MIPNSDLIDLLKRTQSYETQALREETGMLDVDGRRLLFVATLPKKDRGEWGVVVCHSHFELSALQAAELELLRGAAAEGLPGVYVEAPGMGDSEGDDSTCTVSARVDAALAAWDQLRARSSGVGRPCFVGVRSGAIVALRCAATVEGAALLLWDPALDIDAYWRQVRRLARVAAVAGAQQHFREPNEELAREGRVTVTGVGITPAILDDLRRSAQERPRVSGPLMMVLPRHRTKDSVRSQLVLDEGADVTSANLSQRDLWHAGMRSGRDAIAPSLRWMKAELA